MKIGTIIFIIYCIISLVGVLFVYSELKERNKLMEDDPCEYYKEHCTQWKGMESIDFNEIFNETTTNI